VARGALAFGHISKQLRGHVAQLSGTTSFSARADSIAERRIEFTLLGRWSILELRENEENAPRFQRSGKTVGCVCVSGGGDAAVGASLGRRVAGCGRGLLRWSDVPVTWAWAKKSSNDTNTAKDAPMAGCEHHGKAAMDCTMACCHPSDTAVTGAIVFVLPNPMALSAPLFLGPPSRPLAVSANSFVFDPAFPPPRTLLLSL